MCQLLVLAVLGYGLDLSCSISACCATETDCCSDCFFPAQRSDKADQTVHLKLLGTAPVHSSNEFLSVSSSPVAEVTYLETRVDARAVSDRKIDPVRGPPSLS
jgi:hypothetical protein